MSKPACESSRGTRAAFGEITHLPGFIDSNGEQAAVQKDAVQVPRSVTDLQNPIPFDVGDYAFYPFSPAVKRNARRDKIIRKGKLVIK